MDQVRSAVRVRHYSRRTEEAYTAWVRRYLAFHGMQHPATLTGEHVSAFLSSLATHGNVSASTQNQALSALVFLYKVVLQLNLGAMPTVARPSAARRLPVVSSRLEVSAVLSRLDGVAALVAPLLYGGWLRVREALSLRVKDHAEVSTTMIYTHVLDPVALGVRSTADRL